MLDLHASQFHYAGFWRRFWARLLDTIMLIGGENLIFYVFRIGIPYDMDSLGYFLFINLIYWIIFAVFHASPLQATPGKLALGIKVVDLNGERIRFGRALARGLAEYLSALLLLIGYIMAAFTARKQGLHDRMADTLVIRTRGEAINPPKQQRANTPMEPPPRISAKPVENETLNQDPDPGSVEATAKEGERWTLAGFAEDGRVQRIQITLAELRSTGGVVRFGRDPNRCPLVLSDLTVSGVHGQFRLHYGNLEVSDSGSTNGTSVNQQPVKPHTWVRLVDGDNLVIGGTELRVFHD
jgi:uncharacterized RDD family membrane protein YckC